MPKKFPLASQATINKYVFSPVNVKSEEHYIVVGRINETESGALVSVLSADTIIKTKEVITINSSEITTGTVNSLADVTNSWTSSQEVGSDKLSGDQLEVIQNVFSSLENVKDNIQSANATLSSTDG